MEWRYIYTLGENEKGHGAVKVVVDGVDEYLKLEWCGDYLGWER